MTKETKLQVAVAKTVADLRKELANLPPGSTWMAQTGLHGRACVDVHDKNGRYIKVIHNKD